MHHRSMTRKVPSSLETLYSTLLNKTLALLCALGGFVLVSQYGFAVEGPSGAAVQAPAQFDAIKGEIRARVTKGEFPSFAIGVIQGNTTVWAETFGWADREAHVAAVDVPEHIAHGQADHHDAGEQQQQPALDMEPRDEPAHQRGRRSPRRR